VEWSGGADANLESPKATGGEEGLLVRSESDWGGSRRWVAGKWRRLVRARVVVFFKKKKKDATPLSPFPFSGKLQKKKGSVGECIFCHLPALKSRKHMAI
jgi:hypothetical protein